MNCAQLADVAAELALGVLTGRERADAIAHLDTCTACRQLVSSYAVATDELLRAIAPSVEPPHGFQQRVLAQIAPARSGHGNWLTSLAVAACLALIVGVFAVVRSPHMAFAATQMRTDQGEVVGWVFVDRDSPAIAMKLPGWTQQIDQYGQSSGQYSLRLTSASGETHLLPVSLDSESRWSATSDAASEAASVALVDSNGQVWCHAELG